MKKTIILYLTGVVMFGILVFLILQIPAKISSPEVAERAWSKKCQLEYANTLLVKGLNKESALAFEDYLSQSNANKKELAGICYKLGNIYMNLYEYEKALEIFYKAELLDNQANFMSEMNQKIVEALEKSGMTQQAKYELESRTSLRKPVRKQGVVVARIGRDKILQSEIDKVIDKMPEWMKGKVQTDEGRVEFIKQYVATEVLYRKAKRTGINSSPETREAVENFKKQFVVGKLLQKEIDENLKISPEDIELYYRANKDNYIDPEGIKITYLEVTDKTKKETALDMLEKEKVTKTDRWILKEQTYISGIGEAKDIIAGLLLKEKGNTSDILKIGNKFYIFRIDDKRAKREKSFDEVKSQVEYEYKSNKRNKITNSFLEKALEEQEVEIFYKASEDETAAGKGTEAEGEIGN